MTSLERGGPLEQALVLGRRLADKGLSVHAVCASEAVARRFAEAHVNAVVIQLRRPFDPVRAAAVRRFAAGADIVHAHDRRSGLWVRLWRRPEGRPARVYTVHGLPQPYLPQPMGARRPGVRATLAYRGLEAGLCRRVEAVIVASRALAQLLEERLRFPARRMHVIPNGVEPPAAVNGDGSLVGTVSLLEPVKGLDVFLRAAARVAAARPDTRFAIFGEGSQASALRNLASRLGIAGRVEQPGHVPREEALSRLRVAVSSSYMENCPMSLLEAMATGVPVVATAVGGVPEVAPPGTAELVEAGDHEALAAAILRLTEDPGRASVQAAAARRHVLEHFTAEQNARSTLDLYHSLLSRRP